MAHRESLTNRDGPQAPTAIHGPLDLLFHPVDKANAIADYLEHQLTPRALCEENDKRRLEARVQALIEIEVKNPPERIRPCDFQKLINLLTLKKVCGIDGIPNECLRHLPRRPLVHLTHFIKHCIRLSHLPTSWKKAKVVTLPKPGKDTKFPQNIYPICLLPSTDKVFEKVILDVFQRH
jgi:hypothetical protein